jgi:opacity protein-like surface antigen
VRKIGGLILGVLAVTGLAKADNSFSEIDLTNFQDIPSIIDACDVPIENVSCSTKPNCRRFYITGLWGVSAATLKQDFNSAPPLIENNTENIFTAGIAGGVSFERQRGRLRVEAEWLQRDFWATPYESDLSGTNRDTITDNWSVMANLWRDFMFTTKFGCYGGGGIGGGGFTLVNQNIGGGIAPSPGNSGSPPITAFAWQAGGGLIYQLNDQVTFDVGYRFYQLNDSNISEGYYQGLTEGYSASQVMFSLRMFEPLRSLLR